MQRLPLVIVLCSSIMYLSVAVFNQSDLTVVLPLIMSFYLIMGRYSQADLSSNFLTLLFMMIIASLTAWLQAFGFISPEAFADKNFYSRVSGFDVGRTAGITANKSSFALVCISAIYLLLIKYKYLISNKKIIASYFTLILATFFALSLVVPQGRSELPIAIMFLILIAPNFISSKSKSVTLLYILMFISLLLAVISYWNQFRYLFDLVLSVGGGHRAWQLERVQDIFVTESFLKIIFGIGIDQYQEVYNDKVIHNYFWKMLLEFGLISLFLIIPLMSFVAVSLWRSFYKENKINQFAWTFGFSSSLLIILYHASIVMNAYFYLFLFLLKTHEWKVNGKK